MSKYNIGDEVLFLISDDILLKGKIEGKERIKKRMSPAYWLYKITYNIIGEDEEKTVLTVENYIMPIDAFDNWNYISPKERDREKERMNMMEHLSEMEAMEQLDKKGLTQYYAYRKAKEGTEIAEADIVLNDREKVIVEQLKKYMRSLEFLDRNTVLDWIDAKKEEARGAGGGESKGNSWKNIEKYLPTLMKREQNRRIRDAREANDWEEMVGLNCNDCGFPLMPDGSERTAIIPKSGGMLCGNCGTLNKGGRKRRRTRRRIKGRKRSKTRRRIKGRKTKRRKRKRKRNTRRR